MSSRIEYRAEFEQRTHEVFAAQSEQYALHARLQQLGGKHSRLLQHEPTAAGVRYALLQHIGAEQLPQVVRNLHSGDLAVHRQQLLEADGAGYAGSTTVTVDGVPGEITASTEITPHGAGAVQHTRGEATVRIPLVGRKLESVVAEQVTKLLRKEAEFTARWLAETS